MRVTAARKAETERRIKGAARTLFGERGFRQTTTREVAREAGIAAGTLFNYFPNKNALAMRLIRDAADAGRSELDRRRRDGETLVESLYSHIMCGLRSLAPHRDYVGEVFESAMSPFAHPAADDDGTVFRLDHLQTVGDLVRDAGGQPLTFVSSHLYWSLYLGVLAFWSRDDSTNQEDTLVVLDESLRLFVNSIREDSR